MVKIAVIGWYGTETIGDRAILAGLVRVFALTFGDFSIRLGSLFTVLTERTLLEDIDFLSKCSGTDCLSISIFDSLKPKCLRDNIKDADLLVVGGGPLMDITVMYMLEYAFQIAARKGIKTALLGCGWGPLKAEEYIKCALRIVRLSNLTIFRDRLSEQSCLSYWKSEEKKTNALIDPAFFAASYFVKNINRERTQGHIAINLRDTALDQYGGDSSLLEARFGKMLNDISDKTSLPVYLIPMHTFVIGGDDRVILTKIANKVNKDNVIVLQNPLNLKETMEKYYDAYFCVGMRFHSVVLQTVLNGKNYILDYTEPQKGKIYGMLDELNIVDVYASRYTSLLDNPDIDNLIIECQRYEADFSLLDDYLNSYSRLLKTIL